MPSIRPIDSDMILDLPAIAQPAIQPDGSFVAYVRSSVNRESMRTDARIELVSFEGGGVRVMTSGLPAANPAWAPGGDMLGFLRPVKDGGPQQVWLLAGGGGEARQLTDLPSGVSEFAWSPNSRTICAVADVDPDARDAAGHVPRGIAVHNVYYRGDTLGWRGDAHYHLFSIDVASGKPQQITRGTFDHRAPTFSPDGKRIAFVSARRRDREHRRPFGGEVCVMPAQGGTVRRLAPDVLQADGIAWSPDGKRLAAVLVESDEWLQPYLFVIDVRTGRRRRLTRDDITPAMGFNPLTAPPPPMWMGDRIFFEADAHGTSGVSSATTGGRVRAERSKKEMHNGISISAQSRRMVLVVSTLRQPAELVAQVLGDSRSVRLTRATADYVRAHPPGKVKRIRVRRAGLDVDCWLLFPPNFQPERRYPLVLEIHGGPNSWYGEGFSPLHQIIAGAGHLVLFTNPRGSLTYGHDFADAVTANWGGEDYLDLMAVVDKVCNRPYVDATRLGIHGYSYGGYMASWIVGHTDRFRAAVVGAPVINLVSMYGTSDIGVSWGGPQWGGRPSRNLEWYLERSPISHVDKVRTPVLLLHGDADLRCPISQSEEYFTALQERGRTVEFVRFPDCSHLFMRRGHPALRREYFNRTVAWFKRWL